MTAALLAEILGYIIQLGPIALDGFLKLEGILNLSSDEKQNVANAIASANASDADTIAVVDAFKQAHGLS